MFLRLTVLARSITLPAWLIVSSSDSFPAMVIAIHIMVLKFPEYLKSHGVFSIQGSAWNCGYLPNFPFHATSQLPCISIQTNTNSNLILNLQNLVCLCKLNKYVIWSLSSFIYQRKQDTMYWVHLTKLFNIRISHSFEYQLTKCIKPLNC